MATVEPKIKQIRLSDGDHDIDLPSTAQPSITSITTSGNATIGGTISEGGTTLSNKYLGKTTYEWNKEIAFGNSGFLKIGSFPMYDSNITINIDATTSTTYHGTVLIATQNVSTTSIGSAHVVKVYDDSTGVIAESLRIVWTSGSRNYNVYFVPQPWSKNFIHIRAQGQYLDGATDICISQTGTVPTTTTGLEPVNSLSGFGFNIDAPTISENGTTLANKYAAKDHTHTSFDKISINSTGVGSYNEGVRINKNTTNNWANVVMGGDSGSTEGTISGMWLVGRRGQAGSKSGGAGDFTIEHNGSTGTGLTLYADGSKPRWNNNVLAYASDIPTVNNSTITIKQTGINDQTFTLNGNATTITLADNNTTYTFAEGSTNKAFTVTPSGGTAQTVAIHGLGDASLKGIATTVAKDNSNLVTSGAVWTAIDNLPEPMVFKGTLGTGGTIETLPDAATSNEGFTYKVIKDGTYAGQVAKVGDVFVSNGTAWVLIPAGDRDSDTWRAIKVNGTQLLGSALSTGAINFKNGSNVTITGSGNDITIASSYTDTNQTIKGAGTAFSANDVIDIVAGSNVTVTPNTTNKKITISATDTNTASAVDNILDGSNSGTAITYAPYSAQQSKLSFDTSTTTPTRTDRLNLNGNFYATNVYAGTTKLTGNTGTVTSVATSGTGLSGGTITTSGTITLDSSSAGNAAANKVVLRNAAGSIQSEKVAISSGATTKLTMQYNSTDDCLDFVFE